MRAFLGNILGSLLRLVYDLVSSIGTEPKNFSYYAMAIIITTVLFKLMLLPLSLHQAKSSKKMAELQPLIKEVQTKYKSDPQTQTAKMQEIYKEHNYNPAAGCLPLLIQLPIILAFFAVFREPAKYAFTEPGLYEAMNKTFLWIPNLEIADAYLWGLPLLAAATTYLQSITMVMPNSDPKAQQTQKMMNYFMPVMIFMAARGFPAGLGLYWVIGNMFTVVQQLISKRSLVKIKEER
jgi:YidC/Oxa1 family membrane protein insertase